MLFTSSRFILFLTLTVILYYVVPKKHQWKLLLVANFVFYFFAGLKGFLFIGATITVTYFLSLHIDKLNVTEKEQIKANKEAWTKEEKKKYKEDMKKKRARTLLIGILFNFGILFVLKYANFGISIVNGIFFRGEAHVGYVSLFVPLGISFYTFQIMGYLIDLYYGKYRAERNYFKLALFTSFFPQLIQGPISRFGELSRTLYTEHTLDWNNLRRGFERILWGYFKKVVVADRMLVAVNTLIHGREVGFDEFITYDGTFAFIGMVFYACQLYADFTGGIDIVIGIGEMLGIKVTENFDRPFFSKDIAEYWRRWHITMGVWFKEYIFYPVSVSKWMMNVTKFSKKHFGENIGKKVPVYIASIITWAVTGLWHGAAWNFVVWGLGNCIVIIISEELKPLYDKFHARFPKVAPSNGWKFFQMLRTFLIMSSLRMFDCYRDVPMTFKMFGTMFYKFRFKEIFRGELMNLGLSGYDYIVILIGVIIMFTVSILQGKGQVRDQLHQKSVALECAVFAVMFICILVFGAYGIGFEASQFIYSQF